MTDAMISRAPSASGFKRFLVATGMNTFGDVVSTIALPVIAFTMLGAHAFEVAALVAAEQAAWLVLGLPVGVWVDRWSRRSVIVFGGLLRGLLLASIPLAWWLEILSLTQLFVVAVVTGVIAVFTTTANTAYLPSLVAREDLLASNGKLAVVSTATDTAGQAMAGIIVQIFRAPLAIAIEAILAIASALLVQTTKEKTRTPLDEDSPSTFWRQLVEGVRYTLSHPTFRTILATNVAWNVAMAGQFAIAVPFLLEVVDVNEAAIGVAFAVGGVGGLLGSVAVGRLSKRHGSGAIWRAALTFGPILGLLAPLASLAPGLLGAALYGLGTGFLGAAIAMISVITGAARQAICPPHLLGRLGAVSQFISWGIIPVGALVFGALGSWIGLEATMWATGATFFLCVVIARFSSLWKSRSIEVDLAD